MIVDFALDSQHNGDWISWKERNVQCSLIISYKKLWSVKYLPLLEHEKWKMRRKTKFSSSTHIHSILSVSRERWWWWWKIIRNINKNYSIFFFLFFAWYELICKRKKLISTSIYRLIELSSGSLSNSKLNNFRRLQWITEISCSQRRQILSVKHENVERRKLFFYLFSH